MASLKDVASLAGVSTMTVSRVINDPDKVQEATRQKVRQAMAELKYAPNMAARNLAARRTGVIDVYVPASLSLSDPFVAYFIAGISQELSRRMYSLLILRDLEREHPCDGYIVTGLRRSEIGAFSEYAKARNRPLALFGHTRLPGIDCVDVDNISGAREITGYLLELGHRRIGMVNTNDEKDFAFDRLEGFRQALRQAGVEPERCPVENGSNTFQGGREAIGAMLGHSRPSAVFCASDTMAVGVCMELNSRGIRVPEDISVVGFDAMGHHLLTVPRLTTVRQPIFEAGEALAKALVNRLEGQSQDLHILIQPQLLPADSAIPFRQEDSI